MSDRYYAEMQATTRRLLDAWHGDVPLADTLAEWANVPSADIDADGTAWLASGDALRRCPPAQHAAWLAWLASGSAYCVPLADIVRPDIAEVAHIMRDLGDDPESLDPDDAAQVASQIPRALGELEPSLRRDYASDWLLGDDRVGIVQLAMHDVYRRLRDEGTAV